MEKLNDIAGYELEKKELRKVIDVLNNREKYASRGSYIPKGLILYGEPGNGKTLFAKVLASEINVNFYEFDTTKMFAQSRFKKLYKKASKNGPSIIFIDEGNRFLVSKKFAQLVQGSDNYFVLATREKLPALPYSVSEIYGFRKSGKFHDAKQKYNEIYHLYGEISEEKNINPKLVITEDSNSGFEFFKEMSRQKGVNCFSAGGKSNIIRQLEQRPNEEGTILVIVDGAAFGSEMKDISECIKTQGNIVLYAPESFEWLLLSTKEIPEVKVETILQNPEEYIDSKEYVSWERYFTDLLIESTSKNFIWAYSKKRLTKAYFAPRIVNAVKTIMKLVDWEKSF